MRALRLVVVDPTLALIRFSAWARETASRAAFACRAISRAQHEADLVVAAGLRDRARQLLATTRGQAT